MKKNEQKPSITKNPDGTSSNINEGIKAVLFFKRKDFTRTKCTKTHISKQKQKRQHFYAHKKHLR